MWSSICLSSGFWGFFHKQINDLGILKSFFLDFSSPERVGILLFWMCSNEVCTVFSMSSQNVHQVPNVFPNMFPIALTRAIFLSVSLTLVTYITSPKGGDYTLLVLGTSKDWFFVFFHGPIKDAHQKRKEFELWVSPPLINMRSLPKFLPLPLEMVDKRFWK
jgi:hypothetical protein